MELKIWRMPCKSLELFSQAIYWWEITNQINPFLYIWISVICSSVITKISIFLQAGKVLWTPQNEDETLSKRQLLEDYPQLADCMKTFLVKKHEWYKCIITFSVLNYSPNLTSFQVLKLKIYIKSVQCVLRF